MFCIACSTHSERQTPASRSTGMTRTFPLALILVVSACAPRGPRVVGVPKPYVGETQAMSEVVAEINANNAALPTLWARHVFEANIADDRGRKHFVNGDGTLVYSSPRGMRLVGNKDV